MSLVPKTFYRKPTVASEKVIIYLKVKKSKRNWSIAEEHIYNTSYFS